MLVGCILGAHDGALHILSSHPDKMSSFSMYDWLFFTQNDDMLETNYSKGKGGSLVMMDL